MRLAAVILSLAICGGLLAYGSGRGFDLTDEAFYLIWTRDPGAYGLVYQPFGYLLHPLFRAVGEDLQAYRLAGFAIAAAAGAFLGQALAGAGRERRLFGLYGAVCGLTIFFPWIVTPSYNSAANVGGLLMLGGGLCARDGRLGWRLIGAVAAGAGLCLAAFAKPPLFAIGVLGILLTAAATPRARLALAAALLLGAGLISAILPPGELLALVRRILAAQQQLGLPNALSALPGKVARDWLAVSIPLMAAAAAAGLSLALPRSRASRWLGYGAVALSVCYVPRLAIDLHDGDIPDFLGLALVILGASYASLLRGELRERGWAIAALLAAPTAVALGTFNNQWGQLNFSMGFPLLALFALSFADPQPWRRRAAQALAVASPVALMLLAASNPYSLPAPILDQQIPVEVPLARGGVRVDPETADFIGSARGLARGDLLIDLSGTGPGVAAVLGGRAPVLPWLNPATPNWPDVVWSRLSPQARERASFVVPIWPGLAGSEPARWVMAHRAEFCATPLPSIPFWREERALQLWRRCD